MKEVHVNEIREENGITHGLAVSTKTALKNIPIVLSGKVLEVVSELVKHPPKEGFGSLIRFCQYIVLIRMDPILGFSMQLSDFHNNLDAALDEYNALKLNNWDKEQRDKIMKLFQDIRNNPTDIATLVDVGIEF